MSVRAPTFSFPKYRSRGSLGLVLLRLSPRSRVCRPSLAQSCSFDGHPLGPCRSAIIALSVTSASACTSRRSGSPLQSGASPRGSAPFLGGQTPSFSGWLLSLSVGHPSLAGWNPSFSGLAPSLSVQDQSLSGLAPSLAGWVRRSVSHPSLAGWAHNVGSWGSSPAWVAWWSVFRAAVGASGLLAADAFCSLASGGLLGSPQLGFHFCHLRWSEPALFRGSKLPRRSERGWTTSKEEDEAMVFNVKEPLGWPPSRRTFPPRPACPANGPERESGSFGRRPVSAGVTMDICRCRANFCGGVQGTFRPAYVNAGSHLFAQVGIPLPIKTRPS